MNSAHPQLSSATGDELADNAQHRPNDSPDGPDSPDGLVARELAVEQAHVDAVYARLDEATRSAQQVARQGRALHQSDRGSYLREEDGTGLYERDVFAFQAAKRLAVLDAEHEGLVFGRLDHTDGEVRYVGRIGVRTADYEPLVIDWRAPAAAAFYRATPAEPMSVVRRRVLRCSGIRVIGIEDDLLDSDADRSDLVVVGEGALMASLTRARGHSMRDIVATIQAEQDEAIRAPYAGFTMISGGPGTGKTVVALHRAAYLLYSHRRRFENGGVLVVGPSRVFMNYIERVLPSLGEESVTLRSIGSVAADVVPIRGDRIDEQAVAAIKGSLRMVRVLKRLVQEPPQTVPLELRLTLKGHVLRLDPQTLQRIRADVLRFAKLNPGREAAERAVLAALWQRAPAELEMEREEFEDRVTDTAAFEMFVYAWWPAVSAPAMLARLADPAMVARVADSVLSRADQERLAESYAAVVSGPAPGEGRESAPSEWTAADGALLDELTHLLGPLPETTDPDPLFLDERGGRADEVVTTADRLATPRETDPFATPHETYAHVLVDEAQDITPMQWRMLRRRGASASWTIVGDPAQSSWPDPAEYDRALAELVGSAPVRRFRLSTNYRSPAEVFDLAARVVVQAYPDADLPRAVRSTGIAPELLTTSEEDLPVRVGELLQRLAGSVGGTMGVIGPPSRQSALTAAVRGAGLADPDRVVVVTPLQAKGLEYDAALVVAPDQIVAESPGGVRTLYVALTRPTQRLVTLDVGDAGASASGVSASGPVAAWRKSLG